MINFRKIYNSCHQLPYSDPTADSLAEHISLCFSDPECLREMSNIRQKNTGIPMLIWVDNNQSYKKSGHGKRLKFQKNYSTKFDSTLQASMQFDGTIVEDTNVGSKLTKKDEQQLRNFVYNNYYALDALIDKHIDIIDFGILMIPGYEVDEELRNDQKEELINTYGVKIDTRS
jgi:hypothetical protein